MVKLFGRQLNIPGIPPQCGVNIIQSKWFEDICRKAFMECDLNRDGSLDDKEVYICLLKMYDLINRKLPYHVRVPSIMEVNELIEKYDKNGNHRFEFPEFLECCKGLIGNRKDWQHSLFLKITVAVALKALGFPFLAGLIKETCSQLGIVSIQRVPVGAITYVVESAAQQISS